MQVLQILFAVALGISLVSAKSVEQNEGKRLIKRSEEGAGVWMTENQIFELIRNQVQFVDITGFHNAGIPVSGVEAPVPINAIPTETRFNSTVRSALRYINNTIINEFLRHFTSYHTRYHNSATGAASQQWLLNEVSSSVASYPGTFSVSEIDHNFPQKSIIARLEGSDPSLSNQLVILGAHLDSVSRFGSSQEAPGADDNGSGTITILTALRHLVREGIVPKRTLEFHWYAAEEIGLVGSQAIAVGYLQRNASVAAMLNFDVVAYHENGVDDVGIYTDNGNAQVQQFLRVLTEEYLNYGWRDRTCGYGCSDHASWNTAGYPAAMASEVVWHPYMHTGQDNIASINYRQLSEFIKLAISFAIEIAEPTN